jgi:hypothetical protein
MPPKVVKVDASPLRILTTLEQAAKALGVGDVARGRDLVGDAVHRLATAKAQQDEVLDEVTRIPEPRAERTVAPLHEGAP